MKKLVYIFLVSIPLGLQAQFNATTDGLYVGPGETVWVEEGTPVFFAGVAMDTTGADPTLTIQSTASLITPVVINGEVLGDGRINLDGPRTDLTLSNGTWSVKWAFPDNDEVMYNLELDGDAALVVVPPTSSLTVDNILFLDRASTGTSMILQADNTGYGQLLNTNPLTYSNTSGFGQVEAQQYFSATTTPGWRQISVPVVTVLDDIKDDFSFSYTPVAHTGGPQDSTQNVWWYDASPKGPIPTFPDPPNTSAPGDNSPTNAKHWTYATGTENIGPAANGKSWDIWMGTPNSILDPITGGATDGGRLTVTGLVGNGSYTFNLYSTNDYITGQSATVNPLLVTGWNNIQNPYPSNIDVSALLGSTEFDISYKAVHVWNPKAGPNPRQQYLAITDGLASFTNWNTGNGVDQTASNIAPFQSFWVQADDSPTTAQTEDIELTHAVRTVTDAANYFKTAPPNIRLRVADLNEEYTDQTVLAFTPEATMGVDDNDAQKLMSPNRTVPNLYTQAEGRPLSINRLPNPAPYHSVPMSVTSIHKGKEYTIDMRDENIDPAWTIYLEDVKTGKMHNLRNGEYSFTHDASMKTNRFVVHINKMPGNVDPSSWNNVSIYANADGINVAFANPDVATAEVTISNLAGQLIYTGTVSTGRVFTFPVNEDIALYAVQVVTGTKVTHDKVVK